MHISSCHHHSELFPWDRASEWRPFLWCVINCGLCVSLYTHMLQYKPPRGKAFSFYSLFLEGCHLGSLPGVLAERFISSERSFLTMQRGSATCPLTSMWSEPVPRRAANPSDLSLYVHCGPAVFVH